MSIGHDWRNDNEIRSAVNPPSHNYPQRILPPQKKSSKITPLKLSLAGIAMIPITIVAGYGSLFAGFLVWEGHPELEGHLALAWIAINLVLFAGIPVFIAWGAVLGLVTIVNKGEKRASSIVSVVIGAILLFAVALFMATVMMEIGIHPVIQR